MNSQIQDIIIKRKPCSEETKRKIGLANSRPKVEFSCKVCGKKFLVPKCREYNAKFCSTSCQLKSLREKPVWNKGLNKFSDYRLKKLSDFNILLKIRPHQPIGFRHSENTRKKISAIQQGLKVENWKGYLEPKNTRIRKSTEYKLWRVAVFQRDNFTCVWCGITGIYVQADHIKPFSLFPELRFAIDNGRTLCKSCHKKTDTYGRKVYNYAKSIGMDKSKIDS